MILIGQGFSRSAADTCRTPGRRAPTAAAWKFSPAPRQATAAAGLEEAALWLRHHKEDPNRKIPQHAFQPVPENLKQKICSIIL